MNRVESLHAQADGPAAFAAGYLAYVGELLRGLDADAVAAFLAELTRARDDGHRVFFLGNGGSAATATHFANDMALSTRGFEHRFRAISLTDNASLLTTIANDMGYEHIFTEQLRTHLEPGDVVVAISASGKSENLLRGVQYANEHGATTIGLTGFDGGRLRELCALSVHVDTAPGEYGPVEDVHMVLDHLVAAYLLECSRAERAAGS